MAFRVQTYSTRLRVTLLLVSWQRCARSWIQSWATVCEDDVKVQVGKVPNRRVRKTRNHDNQECIEIEADPKLVQDNHKDGSGTLPSFAH